MYLKPTEIDDAICMWACLKNYRKALETTKKTQMSSAKLNIGKFKLIKATHYLENIGKVPHFLWHLWLAGWFFWGGPS